MKEKLDRVKWETILLGKKEALRREQIRKRKSYAYWESLWQRINRVHKPELMMWVIFEAIDKHHGWKYLTQAGYAEQALNRFLQDVGVQKEFLNRIV